jgi:hypothetical protein
MNILNNDLIELSNDIFVKYSHDGEVNGLIKTSYDESPTHQDFLLLKRDLIKRLSILDANYYIDDIEFKFGTYSKDVIYNEKHQWDGVGFIFSFGLITPFILPNIITDLYKYYNTTDYNYISYNIKKRKSNII